MAGVYEALQRVRQSGNAPVLPGERPARLSGEPLPTRQPGPIAVELTPLLSAVRPLLDSGRGAVLHFVAAGGGEGTSTIAREFALLAGTSGAAAHCWSTLRAAIPKPRGSSIATSRTAWSMASGSAITRRICSASCQAPHCPWRALSARTATPPPTR